MSVVVLPQTDAQIQAWLTQFQGAEAVRAGKALAAVIRYDALWGYKHGRYNSYRPRFSKYPLYTVLIVMACLFVGCMVTGLYLFNPGPTITGGDTVQATVTDVDTSFVSRTHRYCGLDYEYDYDGRTYTGHTSGGDRDYCHKQAGDTITIQVDPTNPSVSNDNMDGPGGSLFGMGMLLVTVLIICVPFSIIAIVTSRRVIRTADKVQAWATQAEHMLGTNPAYTTMTLEEAIDYVLDHSRVPIETVPHELLHPDNAP